VLVKIYIGLENCDLAYRLRLYVCVREVNIISLHTHTHTHTQNLDLTEARDSEWQWHQLGHMQVCTSLQTDNHASTPPLTFFTGRIHFLPPNQQRQSTEGIIISLI